MEKAKSDAIATRGHELLLGASRNFCQNICMNTFISSLVIGVSILVAQAAPVLAGSPASAALKPQSADPLTLDCKSKAATTTFQLRSVGDEVVLTTIHHNGTKYMPIHEGVVVPNDIKYLKEKSTLLEKMGDRNEFRFPRAKCHTYGKGLMGCFGGDTKKFGDTEMTALSFNTAKMRQQAFDTEVEYTKVTLSVQISGYVPVQDLVMYYYDDECKFSF
jgi:hypothetical protein